MSATEDGPKITRLTGTRYPYRCEKCDDIDWGNDHDKRHVEWRKKHWAECWGLTIPPDSA